MIRFIHIPKTAGTSVIDWLRHNKVPFKLGRYSPHKGYTKQHSTAYDWHSAYPEKERNFFTIVRNPFTRIVSYYNFLVALNVVACDFKTFIRNPEQNFVNGHKPWKKQVEYLLHPKTNKFLVKKIFKFENNFEKQMKNYFKIKQPLPKNNVGIIDNSLYMEKYFSDSEDYNIIKKYFYDDFKILGYTL